MLNSWDEIQTSLKRYRIQSTDSDAAVLEWRETGAPTVIFQLKFAGVWGRDRLFIGVHVAPDRTEANHEALVMNSELAIGALSAFRGSIMLKHVMTVGRFDGDELHEVFAAMAFAAAQAERRLSRRSPAANLQYLED